MKDANFNIILGSLSIAIGLFYFLLHRNVNPIWCIAAGLGFIRVESLRKR